MSSHQSVFVALLHPLPQQQPQTLLHPMFTRQQQSLPLALISELATIAAKSEAEMAAAINIFCRRHFTLGV